MTERKQKTNASTPASSANAGASPSKTSSRDALRGMTYDQQVSSLTPPGNSPTVQKKESGARGSRVEVVAPANAARNTYPGDDGGQVTMALLEQLQGQKASLPDAVAQAAKGNRGVGDPNATGEERAGVGVGTSSGSAERKRVAVVIGNADYRDGAKMGDTVNDAGDIDSADDDSAKVGKAAEPAGYEVVAADNQTASQMSALLWAAKSCLSAGDELAFFFSGHGLMSGLVGVDGELLTPETLSKLHEQLRGSGIDFTLALDACHAGIFADVIRESELQRAHDAADGKSPVTHPHLVAVPQLLEVAIALQQVKVGYNAKMEPWWSERFAIEADLEKRGMDAWNAHFNKQAEYFQSYVDDAAPLLPTLVNVAELAGLELQPVTTVTMPAVGDDPEFYWPQENLNHVMTAFDDVDTSLNRVLQYVDGRLGRN